LGVEVTPKTWLARGFSASREVFSSNTRGLHRENLLFPEATEVSIPAIPLSMKTLTLALISLSALATGAFAQIPVGPTSIKLGKIEISGVKTPEYQITGGQNKRYKLGTWLEFEVGYDTVPEEIDELTFKFSALIEKKLLDGEVTYVNIAKGKDHYGSVYISPKAIDKLTGGKPLSPAAIENVWVEVSRQGQVLGKVSHRPGAPPNVPHLTGLILNKTQTPFAPLFYDRYEEVKPGVSR
jgi:hypothetical protein